MTHHIVYTIIYVMINIYIFWFCILFIRVGENWQIQLATYLWINHILIVNKAKCQYVTTIVSIYSGFRNGKQCHGLYRLALNNVLIGWQMTEFNCLKFSFLWNLWTVGTLSTYTLPLNSSSPKLNRMTPTLPR